MKTINKLVLLEGNEVVLSKEEAIKKLADKLEEAGFLTSCNEFLESVYLREEIAPTTVGYGIGLPHGKGSCVKESVVAFMRVKNPILWNIQDDEKVKIVFMLAVSEEEGKGTHNDILVELSKKILDSNFRNRIENSSSCLLYTSDAADEL